MPQDTVLDKQYTPLAAPILKFSCMEKNKRSGHTYFLIQRDKKEHSFHPLLQEGDL